MIIDKFSVRVSLPTKGGSGAARAEAEFLLGDTRAPLSMQQALDLSKALKTAAAVGEIEMYVSVIKTSIDDSYKVT